MSDRAVPAAPPMSRAAPGLGDAFANVLDAARAGAEWAWSRIYGELAPAVRGYLRRQGASDADDLLGEVFLQVVRGLPGFEGDEASFRSWVFVIAHHRLLDERRRRTRRREDPLPEAFDMPSAQDVEDEALARFSSENVRRMLAALSPDQRDVLLLRIVGGLSIEEAAAAVGKRPGAVKALQRRGLAAVRRELDRQGVPS